MNVDGEQYSNEQLLSQAVKNKEKSPNQIIESVLDSVREHTQAAPQSDDIAMLIIKYNGAPKVH